MIRSPHDGAHLVAPQAQSAGAGAATGEAGGQAAAAEGAGWERVARIWAAARSASSREAVRAGGPPALRSMARRSAGQGRGEGQSEARAAREDIPGVEVEVQEESSAKISGSPGTLESKPALLEAPESRVSGTTVRT